MRAFRWYIPWVLVAPALIWVLVFALWPFLNTVVLSFTDARPLTGGSFVGLENYQALLTDQRFWNALVTSLAYVVLSVPFLTVLPLLLALLVEKQIPGISAFRTTFYFPVIASVVVVGLIWTWLFDSRGIVNEALEFIGLIQEPIPFLASRWGLILTAVLLTVWKGLGYYMVVYLAALGNVGRELHEAAAMDGANSLRRLLSVTIPGVRGAMFLVSALITVSAMRVFTELYVLSNGSGGPGGSAASIVMLVQQTGSGLQGRLGYASAVSVALFLLTIGPLLLVAYLNRGDKPAKGA
ncbi:carbohydrate ABC transporter permease [Brachybacterium saurashtrense]|uniref:Sugar ABC transporter permease n=1 Tax=Brachybacterium saurashtrense TaxID=556288 RepID=A0A345YL47_9MICO|nr:sugar ABC transporter permease [Brachybacterium saurashtrense]AXK44649.1 sugar ABC transporter permease [Brachybacterium saurashtrense]RRR23261.1 sugar ABC transporter permease [Brachybacterium saurashtrense]